MTPRGPGPVPRPSVKVNRLPYRHRLLARLASAARVFVLDIGSTVENSIANAVRTCIGLILQRSQRRMSTRSLFSLLPRRLPHGVEAPQEVRKAANRINYRAKALRGSDSLLIGKIGQMHEKKTARCASSVGSSETVHKNVALLCKCFVNELEHGAQEISELFLPGAWEERNIEPIIFKRLRVEKRHRVRAVDDVSDALLLKELGILRSLLIPDVYGGASSFENRVHRVVQAPVRGGTTSKLASLGIQADFLEQLPSLLVEI